MHTSLRTLVLSLPLLGSVPASAQLPLVDITLVDNGTELEVRFRPDGDFDELFSSLAFTIRWETSSGASLGSIDQVSPVQDYMPTYKSGDEEDSAGYRYQPFVGFGLTPLYSIGESWTAATEYTLMTIPVVGGTSVFEIVNDGWTTVYNAGYYVSLNGSNQTGIIYITPTGLQAIGQGAPSVELIPNPTDSGFSTLVAEVPDASDLRLEVLNAAGQIVHARSYEGFAGTLREKIDLSKAGPGVYMVTLEVGDQRYLQRLVVR